MYDNEIKSKLNNLCNKYGVLKYRKVEHPLRDNFDNLMVRKQVIQELKNKIIYFNFVRIWLYCDFFNEYMYEKEMEIKNDLYITYRDNIEEDYNCDYEAFEKSTIFKEELAKNMGLIANMTESEKLEQMFSELESLQIYKKQNNFFELLDNNGNIIELDNKNDFSEKLYEYFGCMPINYALYNGLDIPYVDLININLEELKLFTKEINSEFTDSEGFHMICEIKW